MARIFVTGSSDGLGRAAAIALVNDGHQVITHVRNEQRREAVADLLERGTDVVVGDLSNIDDVRSVAQQVNDLGAVDAVIHNAGVYQEGLILPVNVVAPYLLTALIEQPERLVYLSSGMHRSGHSDLSSVDWAGNGTASYSDSKLFVTALTFAIARLWPVSYVNAVDPGWVPTKMGGSGATDDLELGHITQNWLATSNDSEARTTGGYWFHQKHSDVHPAANDEQFQDELLDSLARYTGEKLS